MPLAKEHDEGNGPRNVPACIGSFILGVDQVTSGTANGSWGKRIKKNQTNPGARSARMMVSPFSGFGLAFALLAMALSGCANRTAASFKEGRPIFDPGAYFNGKTHSWGVIESRGGEPRQMLTTQTEGHWKGDTFHFEQDLAFEKKKNQHRSWLIRRVDAHRYTATGTGIVGEARGEAYGNVFHLEFTLDLVPGNPLLRVHMAQWMYLQPDGRTMINRAVLTKAGVVVAQITEQFVRSRGK